MDFEELLEMLQNPGDEGLPDTIYDDLRTSYSDNVSSRDAAIGERDEKIAGHEGVVQGYESEISRLKALMFDKLIGTPVDDSDGGEENEESGSEEDDESDENISIDDLFKDKD